MNITQTLQEAIDQLKKTGEPELRNKLISALKTARYLSELMDYKSGERFDSTGNLDNVDFVSEGVPSSCICPQGGTTGAFLPGCPVHGSLV